MTDKALYVWCSLDVFSKATIRKGYLLKESIKAPVSGCRGVQKPILFLVLLLFDNPLPLLYPDDLEFRRSHPLSFYILNFILLVDERLDLRTQPLLRELHRYIFFTCCFHVVYYMNVDLMLHLDIYSFELLLVVLINMLRMALPFKGSVARRRGGGGGGGAEKPFL